MSKSRDIKNLKSVARAYGSRLIHAIYREYSEELIRLEASAKPIELPARDEERLSIGVDRCLIPDARIGWIVHLYEAPPRGEVRPLASGRVRKFVAREGRQDLTILRLSSGLHIKPLLAKQKPSTQVKSDNESSSSVILYAVVENPTMLQRCLRTYFAIDAFMRLRCSESIAKLLIGDLYPNPITWRHPPRELLLPSSIQFKLSRDQNRALQIAIKKHIAVIEGVVGSGKTHLAACIAHCLAVQKYQKILVCSPNSGTIDVLAKLLMTNETSCDDRLSVIQVTNEDHADNKSLTKSIAQSTPMTSNRLRRQLAKSCKLNHLVAWELYANFQEKHRTIYNVNNNNNNTDSATIERLTEKNVAMCCKRTRKKAQHRLLSQADIVCCTIEQASRKLVSQHQFDVLIIDDCQHASDADILIPLMYRNLKQIVLIGEDDVKLKFRERQSEQEAATAIGRNLGQERYRLFSRLVNSYGPMAKLTQQYRAAEKLMEFCNGHFYRSKLRTNENASRRFVRRCVALADFSWLPKFANTMSTIFSLPSDQQQQQTALTHNLTIERLINKLVKVEKFPKSSITILSNLDHWQRKAQSMFGVEVKNVLDMAGVENDFIILSCQQPTVKCHRLSHELEPDFSRNEQALHIALTRAKLGLFVVVEQALLDMAIASNMLNESMSQSSTKSVTWIDQEPGDFCVKWRKFINYHHELETIVNAAETKFDST